MKQGRNREKGQAVAEMALFASLLLVVFGVMISYVQRLNDQQYIQMDAFRRALEKGCTYQGSDTDGAGASVQYTSLENRRTVDVSSGYRQGSAQIVSGSGSVFWAVPKSGGSAESMMYYKINEDELSFNYEDLQSQANNTTANGTFGTGDLVTGSETEFNETYTKQETPMGIATTRMSKLRDTVTTSMAYDIKKNDTAAADNGTVVSSGELFSITQGLYVDSDGKYKYSSSAVGNTVERGKTWETSF